MDRKYILVVDDELNTLNSLEFILEAASYEVGLATNCQEALLILIAANDTDNPVELLILDVEMPGLASLGFVKELKQLNINIPIFLISGYGHNEQIKELLKLGCNAYFEKPFDEKELLLRIDDFFDKQSIEKTKIHGEERQI